MVMGPEFAHLHLPQPPTATWIASDLQQMQEFVRAEYIDGLTSAFILEGQDKSC